MKFCFTDLQGGGAFSFLEASLLSSAGSSDFLQDADEYMSAIHPSRNQTSANLTDLHNNQTFMNASGLSARRRLLSTALENDDDDFVRTYSSWVASTRGFSNIAIGKSKLTDSWLQGPLQWPPRYNHLADSSLQCQAVEESVSSILQVSMVLKKYYTSDVYLSTVSLPPWEVQDNIPSFLHSDSEKVETTAFMKAAQRPLEDRGDLPAATFYYVLDGWITPILGNGTVNNISRAAASFFNLDSGSGNELTARGIIRNSLVCDFEAVIFCRRENMPSRKNLVVSFIISYLIYLLISLVLQATMITGIIGPVWRIFGLWFLVPMLAFQFAYGVGPACFPMVPACLLQDVMLFVQAMAPLRIEWPLSLQNVPGCASNSTLIGNNSTAACLKSCRDGPFYFRSWESSVSWLTCSYIVKDCETIPVPYVVASFTDIQQAFLNHSMVVRSADKDLWHGHQFCFLVTLGQILPYMLLLLVLLFSSAQIIRLPFVLFSAATQFAWQAVAYTHVE